MTFSIVARCARTGQFGMAISSSSPAVAARCAHVRAGVGAVASQNITDPALGPLVLDRLEAGLPAAEALAAVTASAGDIARITEANESMTAAETHDAFERWDNEFHRRIYDAARNEFLISLHRILSVIRSRPAMQELRRRTFNAGNRQVYCDQHRDIMQALLHRDAAAAAFAMRAHLATRKRVYFGE